MRRKKVMLGACLALCAGQTAADESGLDWLAGHWCGNSGGQQAEEVWLPEAGGALLGMSRTLRGSKVESFEYMRIVSDDKASRFHAQPNGLPPTVFAQVARGDAWIRFENPAHDFPNRIEYRREGELMRAYIAGPGRDGKELKITFAYHRCRE